MSKHKKRLKKMNMEEEFNQWKNRLRNKSEPFFFVGDNIALKEDQTITGLTRQSIGKIVGYNKKKKFYLVRFPDDTVDRPRRLYGSRLRWLDE